MRISKCLHIKLIDWLILRLFLKYQTRQLKDRWNVYFVSGLASNYWKAKKKLKTAVAQLEICLLVAIEDSVTVGRNLTKGSLRTDKFACLVLSEAEKSHTKLFTAEIIFDPKNRMWNRNTYVSLTHFSTVHIWKSTQNRRERFKSLDHKRILVTTQECSRKQLKIKSLSICLQACTLRRILEGFKRFYSIHNWCHSVMTELSSKHTS